MLSIRTVPVDTLRGLALKADYALLVKEEAAENAQGDCNNYHDHTHCGGKNAGKGENCGDYKRNDCHQQLVLHNSLSSCGEKEAHNNASEQRSHQIVAGA